MNNSDNLNYSRINGTCVPTRFDDDYDTPAWRARVDAYYKFVSGSK